MDFYTMHVYCRINGVLINSGLQMSGFFENIESFLERAEKEKQWLWLSSFYDEIEIQYHKNGERI